MGKSLRMTIVAVAAFALVGAACGERRRRRQRPQPELRLRLGLRIRRRRFGVRVRVGFRFGRLVGQRLRIRFGLGVRASPPSDLGAGRRRPAAGDRGDRLPHVRRRAGRRDDRRDQDVHRRGARR